jgi:hypothetical protein
MCVERLGKVDKTLCCLPLLDIEGLWDIKSPFGCQVVGLSLVGKWLKIS